MLRSRCVALLVFGAFVALPAAAERMAAQSEPATPLPAARDAAAAVPASWSALPHVRALQSLPAPTVPGKLPGDLQKGVVPGPLDGAWFRLKMSAKGFRVDQATEKVGKASFETVAYMRVGAVTEEGVSGLIFMEYDMWTQPNPGDWQLTHNDTFVLGGANTELTVWNWMVFEMDGFFVSAVHNGTLKIKLDKQGELVKANWKTVAGNLGSSFLPSADPEAMFSHDRFWGSLKITGNTVPIAKLPFEVLP